MISFNTPVYSDLNFIIDKVKNGYVLTIQEPTEYEHPVAQMGANMIKEMRNHLEDSSEDWKKLQHPDIELDELESLGVTPSLEGTYVFSTKEDLVAFMINHL